MKSAAGANSHAGRVGAMHTGLFAEQPSGITFRSYIILKMYNHIGISLQRRWILVSTGMFCLTGLEPVPLLAGKLATTARCTF
jgi:hypothetical protein